MTQAHSQAIWRESSRGAVSTVVPLVFVSDGAGNITLSPTGPEEFALYNTGDGNYTLLPVPQVYTDRLRVVAVAGNIQMF